MASPVCAPAAAARLATDADEVVCLETPQAFFAIGQFYGNFQQISDDEVRMLLRTATGRLPPDVDPRDDLVVEEDVTLVSGGTELPGRLSWPARARSVVLFAHGSGSSRNSPRNLYVARALNRAGHATLLFDLLTPDEESDPANVFNVELLAGRLADATRWLSERPKARGAAIGYFGASTGAAAALLAAASVSAHVFAVVSRGGRVDLAGDKLRFVRAATLLIVGGEDHAVLHLNRIAQQQFRCENRLEVVPGATHLFEEPGALESVARLAADWFSSHVEGGRVAEAGQQGGGQWSR